MKSLWFIMLLFLVSGCNNSEPAMIKKMPSIMLALNESVKNVVDGAGSQFSRECMENSSLCWYKFERSANEKDLPDVKVKGALGQLNLEQVIGITIVADKRAGDDVENINVTLRGLPDNSSHEKNKDFIVELIGDIKSSGWKRYYFVEDPRISGSQAEKINSRDEILGSPVSSHPWFDPDYPIESKRWLKMGPMYKWYFYQNGEYLSLAAWRRDSNDEPTKTGTYLVSLEFQSEREFWLSGITDEQERENWKSLLPHRLKDYHATRVKLEEKARAAGIEIDEIYQDPPIQALIK